MRPNLVFERSGLTPIVSIVLLLMMVVALTGALFTWMTQIQEGTQDEFADQFQTSVEPRAIDCIHHEEDDDVISMSLRNTGEQPLDATAVDVYVYDQDQTLDMLMTEDWSDKLFTEPGDFDDVEVITENQFEPDAFYTVTVEFPHDNEEVRAGGCIAE